MASQDVELESLFEKLDSCLENYQLKKGLKICADILKRSPKDKDALRAYTVLLVETAAFSEALVFMKKHALGGELAYEQAYSLYRLGRNEDALKALASVGDDKAEAKAQLTAQLQYRLGDAAAALDTYNRLHKEMQVESQELVANLVAAMLLAGRGADALALVPSAAAGAGRRDANARPSFEVTFNRGCCLMEAGQYEAAEEELMLAQRLGRESLFEEGLGEDEVEAELAPVALQLAYTYAKLGRSVEATAGYSALLARNDVRDEAALAAAKNNVFVERLGAHLHKKLVSDALKKLETLMDKANKNKLRPDLESRLAPASREALHVNHALLLLLAGKVDAARSLTAWLAGAAPGSPAVAMLHASLLAQDGKLPEADAVLARSAETSPGAARPATLLRAQLAAGAGAHAQAASLLSSLAAADAQLAHAPALVASLVGLQLRLGDVGSAQALLEGSLAHWQAAPKGVGRQAALEWLLQQLAGLALRRADVGAAAQYYRQLQQLTGVSSGGVLVLARLARAMAVSQPDAARQLEAELPPMGFEIDAQALEAASIGEGVAKAGKRKSGLRAMDVDTPADGGVVRAAGGRKRRKRKPLYPKGFDPANPGPPPDPERWLPKWQRSDFKKKRTSRSRGKEVVKGSQGDGKVDESLDIDKAPAKAKSAAPVLPPKGVGGKKGGKKGRK